MNVMTTAEQAPDYTAIKSKQNAAWSSGDYKRIGVTLQITGEELAETAGFAAGSRILDVAAGNGNATLAFARRWCAVTSTDYVASLLEGGQRRADAENLDVTFEVADAEDLPFADGAFDGVVSTFGVMFTPNQERSASEMVRVCRSGGKIAMANWTPDGFIGALFRTMGKHVPPPPGMKSPALWGDRRWIGETFEHAAGSISTTIKHFNFRYASPQQFIDYFRTFYGPMHKAFAAVGAEGEKALMDDLLALIDGYNAATDGSMLVPSDYAEIIVEKA
ncbi:class I SAM-dependent methyltransferase [Hoeflea poritis]|uniref:Class I SAM-dependent methyltransferase n=1 Tax=Hoeflea poritis TaxID=2993659 RepID=A0ABT4VM31_9HYPH|nr:class I SAM-dependent methyltransferase [Hoeflea poritis]MDA4845726.1 class I SAM-dependent methyltransferase [Hoeflea poritis]